MKVNSGLIDTEPQVTVVRRPDTGDPVAITLVDSEHRILKVLWESEVEPRKVRLDESEYLAIFEEARCGSTKPAGYRRGIRAVLNAYKSQRKLQERKPINWRTDRILVTKQDIALCVTAGLLLGATASIFILPFLARTHV